MMKCLTHRDGQGGWSSRKLFKIVFSKQSVSLLDVHVVSFVLRVLATYDAKTLKNQTPPDTFCFIIL